MLPIETSAQWRQWPQTFSRRVQQCKAMQVDVDNLPQVVAWIGGKAHTWSGNVVVPLPPKNGAVEGGEMVAHPGDWIVQVGERFSIWVDELFTREWVPTPTARPHVYEWHPDGAA